LKSTEKPDSQKFSIDDDSSESSDKNSDSTSDHGSTRPLTETKEEKPEQKKIEQLLHLNDVVAEDNELDDNDYFSKLEGK